MRVDQMIGPSKASNAPAQRDALSRWQHAVIREIAPISIQDSNDDGKGACEDTLLVSTYRLDEDIIVKLGT
jgi:hypothetical protein